MRGSFIDMFCDITFHTKGYRFLNILEPCSIVSEHSSHRLLIDIEYNNNEATSPFHNLAGENRFGVSKVSPLINGIQ